MILTSSSRLTALLLSVFPVLGACTNQSSPQDAIQRAEAVQRAIAALPPACTLAPSSLGGQGNWVNTTKAVPQPGSRIVNVFGFDKAIMTRALRVALDLNALRDIEKVETRDAQGNWSDAGPVVRYDAPMACEYVWLEQELPQMRQVEALRFTFRREIGTMTAASPGVLQEPAR